MFQITQKLKLLRPLLKDLNRRHFGSLNARVDEAENYNSVTRDAVFHVKMSC